VDDGARRRVRAEALLRRALGDPDAAFRPGQWQTIDALAAGRRRLLLVRATGWGKSIVSDIRHPRCGPGILARR